MQHTCLLKSSSRGIHICRKLDFGWNMWAIPMVARLCSFANASRSRAFSTAWVLPEHDLAPSAYSAVLEKGPLRASLPSVTGRKGAVLGEGGRALFPSSWWNSTKRQPECTHELLQEETSQRRSLALAVALREHSGGRPGGRTCCLGSQGGLVVSWAAALAEGTGSPTPH